MPSAGVPMPARRVPVPRAPARPKPRSPLKAVFERIESGAATVTVEGKISRVTQTKASPAFPPALSLLTWACIVVWILASIANPATRAALLYLLVSVLVFPLMLMVAASFLPFMRGFTGLLKKAFVAILGAGVLGGLGLVRGVQGATAGGRGQPRDLVVEVTDRASHEQIVIRFPRAHADVSLPVGATILATGRVRGTTVMAEEIEVDTGLGATKATSDGARERLLGWLVLGVFALFALSALASLAR